MSRRVSNKLVFKQIAAIARPGKQSDGNGLYLRVTGNGTRSWIVILIGDGRRREMGLGVPDEASLAQARRLAADAKAAFAEGRDPIGERIEARPRRAAPAPVTTPGPRRRKALEGVVTFWTFAD